VENRLLNDDLDVIKIGYEVWYSLLNVYTTQQLCRVDSTCFLVIVVAIVSDTHASSSFLWMCSSWKMWI